MNQPPSLQPIYLDANATTPVLEPIATSVMSVMLADFGNPSSAHVTGVKAKRLLEETRALGLEIIGTQSGELLFTSGATEGIQTAVVSAISDYLQSEQLHYDSPVLLYGATEHKAVPNTLIHWNKMLGLNARILEIPVDKVGLLDHNFIAEHAHQAVMICTMAVNNETGVKQDLKLLEDTIRAVNTDVAWLVDCVQALGKVPLNMDTISIDYAPFSGHKLYAPKGVGFLYIRNGRPYTPFIAGGGQESGMRSGTENLPGIAGLKALFEILMSKSALFKSGEQLQQHRLLLVEALNDTFEDVSYHSDPELSVSTTINFSVAYLTNKEVMDLFDAAGIRVSGGSACSAGASSSFVLEAMGLTRWQCENAVRLSFGPADDFEFITNACSAIRCLKPSLQKLYLKNNEKRSAKRVNYIGLTQLECDSQSCWLFVTEDFEAIVYNPIESVIQKLSRIILSQNLTCTAILLKQDSVKQQHARERLLSVLEVSNETNYREIPTCQKWNLKREESEQSLSYVLRFTNGKRIRFAEKAQAESSSHEALFTPRGAGFDLVTEKTGLNKLKPIEINSVEEAKSWLSQFEGVVLDVRDLVEHEASKEHVKALFGMGDSPSFINIPRSRLANELLEKRLNEHTPYLLICRTGTRSKKAQETLIKLGFKHVANLSDGLALV
ncbi:aminotransferase class V-fold PLP-dependent enzyme [Pseudoalteromonas luteoviolacea]|uniref:cysteine desulfurase n=1 Tax=Pseudoalteromonas luteoviolacea NCIMB 1942 TaxID=1365253 RepID=A0A167B2U7_9GAMM|nr:aminotransferase class V-fold PLP-dependent enzyme [Pseudoalteromonas luteoviolacea]KZN46095.1 hypothetical protein N482_02320 [Pseudoalteromonas luteoviolacea NCIMB 1942]